MNGNGSERPAEKPIVGIVAPGDMGHACGGLLGRNGLRVVTALAGRSARSVELADAAGMEDLRTLEALVGAADILLSIVPPARAEAFAGEVAAAVGRTGTRPLFVDCNATSPQTVVRIGGIMAEAGCDFLDAGIIGPPPKGERPSPRFYVSGRGAERLAALRAFGLNVEIVGAEVGDASALKMCFATVTKGLAALATQSFTTADVHGVGDWLRRELSGSQEPLLRWFEEQVPIMPPKAYRWVGEMEEIARTFEGVGMSGRMLDGAADVYRFVESTPLGRETPEKRTMGKTLADVAARLAEALRGRTRTLPGAADD